MRFVLYLHTPSRHFAFAKPKVQPCKPCFVISWLAMASNSFKSMTVFRERISLLRQCRLGQQNCSRHCTDQNCYNEDYSSDRNLGTFDCNGRVRRWSHLL